MLLGELLRGLGVGVAAVEGIQTWLSTVPRLTVPGMGR